jgi:diguanylate cyclase (GGDEF)-like protein/PAS domain S-box-containing protein
LSELTEHKRAQKTLREAQERFRNAFSHAAIGMALVGTDGRWLQVNRSLCEIVGYAEEELLAKTFQDTTHPDDLEAELGYIRKLLSDEIRAYQIEKRYFHKLGHVVWVLLSVSLVRDIKGNPLYFIAQILDITERKRAYDRLAESERRLSTLLSNAPAYLYRCLNHPSWPNEFVSDYALEITGYTPEELTDGSVMFGDLIVEEDRERVWEGVQAALAERRRFALRYAIRRRDGEIRHVEEHGQGVYDEDGEVKALEGVVYDVTERKRAEEALKEAETRYRSLVENIPVVTYIQEPELGKVATYTVAYMSPRVEEVLGYPPRKFMDDPEFWNELVHPDDLEGVVAEDARTDETGEPFRMEYRMFARDGRTVWVRDEAVLIRDQKGEPLYWQGIFTDITERKEAEEALLRSEVSLTEAQRMAHLGNWEWDLRTDQLYWSDEVFRICGFEPQQFVPTPERLFEIVHPDDRQLLKEKIDSALSENKTYDFEHRIVRPDGEVRVVHRRGQVIRNEKGEPLKMVGTVHDVTERKVLEEQLEHQALHDPLTNLANRTLFLDRLEHALAQATRREGNVAVMFMDLDDFKIINDSLGHEAGDQLLREIAGRLQACLRPGDTIARLSGDEFAVLLEDIRNVNEATQIAERIEEELRAPIDLKVRDVLVTASIGIAFRSSAQDKPSHLLRNADLALYRAKEKGKAYYQLFDATMSTQALKRLELGNDLRRAMEWGELGVCYQPIVLLNGNLQHHLRFAGSQAIVAPTTPRVTQRIIGMEALVRWEHPKHGLLLPSEFIPIAEETGLIIPIGRWVLEEACRQAREWQEQHPADPPLVICVNLSARQFQRSNLAKDLAEVLRETGLEQRYLELEITESVVMEDAQSTISTLRELKDLGVGLMIDDFGTGYSSLSYLKRFPIDFLKIDRSFVDRLRKDPEDAVIVSGIITLAHTLGMQVIAEGVESAEQLAQLRGLGCNMAQGNYFSEPLVAEAASVLLAANPQW